MCKERALHFCPYLCDNTACSPDVLRGLLMVVELRLPLLNWMVCKSQKDTTLVHQSCSDTASSNIHTQIVAPCFLFARHCEQCQKSVKAKKICKDSLKNILEVEIKECSYQCCSIFKMYSSNKTSMLSVC